MTDKKKKTSKAKNSTKKSTEPLEEVKVEKDEKGSSVSLLEGVDLIIELNSPEFFNEVLAAIKKGKYIGSYDKFVAAYNSSKPKEPLSLERLNGIFCLLIHADCNSLPLYAPDTNQRLRFNTYHLMAANDWKNNFREISLVSKSLSRDSKYQMINVNTSDLTYLFN